MMLGLFLFCGVIIARFLNWGDINFDFLDWSQEGPRYLFLKNAAKEGSLPFFIDSPMVETDRFLGIPDTLLVPQNLLLNFFSIGQYVVINTLINYALGFYFLTRLKVRLGWSLETFFIVAPLATLNGFILSHLAVGHTIWVNAFLLPWLVELCLDFPQEKINWRWTLTFSLFILILFLQGGFHFVLWSWGFVFLFSLSKKATIKPGLVAIFFSALVSMIRILPASITFYTTDRRFIAGFRTFEDLIRSLVQLQLPEDSQILLNSGLPNWETNFYLGLVGALFVVTFGLILPITQKDRLKRFAGFWVPISILTILSLGQILRFTNYLPIPWAHAERVSSRFFYIPLLFLMVIAGDTFNLWWGRFMQWHQKWLVIFGVVVITLHDLAQNARLWRVDRLDMHFTKLAVPVIGNVFSKPDPPYITAIIIGSVVSTSTLIVLLILTRRGKSLALSQGSEGSRED